MIWTSNRTLTLQDDGPVALNTWKLAVALRDAIGDKPSIGFLDGVLLSVTFRGDLTSAQQSTVEGIVTAHDGAAANATDADIRQAQEDARATQKSRREVLWQKRRDKAALLPAEQTEVLDLLMGV